MRGEGGFPLEWRGMGQGEEDKGNHKDGISVTNSESEGDDSEQCIWWEGSVLSLSFIEPHKRDSPNKPERPDEPDPAMQREMLDCKT